MPPGTQLEKSAPAVIRAPGFASRLSGFWGLMRVRWAQMNAAQRRGSAISALLLAALVGGVLWLTLRTDWRTLYTGLDPDDARQIGATLTQAQIAFDLSDSGTGIRVPAASLDKARLATAAKGGAKSGRLGFELFDKPNWVGSEFDEQVNYQRALEGELERTIGTLSDVDSARVHLVLPHDSLFRDQERAAKASVVLKLRRGALADGEADAIRNLVASAVDGLTADHVVLVDAAGHLPLGPRTAEAMELTAEQALEDKLIATLEPVTGAGNVRASVTLDYAPESMEETQESYDPNQTVTLSMQRTEQTSGQQAVAAGVAGAASNAPNASAGGTPVYPRQTTQPTAAKSESGTYAASKTMKHVVENAGRVRRLTAAIVVNDRLVEAGAKNSRAVWQPRSADELRNLTALAQASVGFDAARGDVITVEDIAFDENRGSASSPAAERILTMAESSPVLIQYGSLLACLLLVMVFGVRPALRQIASAPVRGSAKPRELASVAIPAMAAPERELSEADPERMRNQEIYSQVTQHLKREPTQSSRLLQSWIHSE